MTGTQRKRRKQALRIWRLKRTALAALLILLPVCLIARCGTREADARERSAARDPGSEGTPGSSAEPLPPLPEGWEWRQAPEDGLARGTLVLVNRDYAYDPQRPETVSVYAQKTGSYLVKDTILRVDREAMEALNGWMDAFAAESGKRDVNIVAGWRSYGDQEALYQNAVDRKGQAHADAYLALPGHSEHHTGLAVDLDTYDLEAGTSGGFDGEGAYAWAVEHAWEYGFVQRYPPEKSEITGIQYESWHFRYVGLPHAYIMQTESLCLEEYIAYLRGFPFSGEHLFVSCLGRSYELYFCPKDRLAVPSAGDFTVSGNNVDGFVVTISGVSPAD